MAEVKTDRKQALELAISTIERQFGKGSVMRLGAGGPLEEIAVIPTGALSLDVALGVGGVPRGRVVEIYGPESSGKTTLALHIVSEAQRLGGTAAFIDAEHALDPIYARKLGVNIDELLISQPDTGEQALEITETLVRSNAVDVIVIDSVAALVPRAELDGDMGDSLPGLQARLMSQALRKLTAAISRSGAVVVFINQIREKIGVMFGCFHYSTRVVLADGRTEKIGKIVNQRLPVDVLSYDPATGTIQPRRVVNWFDNGRADEFIQFQVAGGRSGYRHFAATENHVIFTPQGRRRAGTLKVGDEVLLSVEDFRLTDDQLQLILGSGLGDGSIRKVGMHTAMFRVGHGAEQKDYLRWKHEMLAPFARAISRTGNGFGFDTLAMPAVLDLCRSCMPGAGARPLPRHSTAWTPGAWRRGTATTAPSWARTPGGVKARPFSTTSRSSRTPARESSRHSIGSVSGHRAMTAVASGSPPSRPPVCTRSSRPTCTRQSTTNSIRPSGAGSHGTLR